MNTSAFEAGASAGVDAVADRAVSASTTPAGRRRCAPDALDERVYRPARPTPRVGE